jgi:hypothetical protein
MTLTVRGRVAEDLSGPKLVEKPIPSRPSIWATRLGGGDGWSANVDVGPRMKKNKHLSFSFQPHVIRSIGREHERRKLGRLQQNRLPKTARANNKTRRFRRDRLAMAEVSASSQAGPLAGEWPRLDEFTPRDFFLAAVPAERRRKKLRPGSDGIGSQSSKASSSSIQTSVA